MFAETLAVPDGAKGSSEVETEKKGTFSIIFSIIFSIPQRTEGKYTTELRSKIIQMNVSAIKIKIKRQVRNYQMRQKEAKISTILHDTGLKADVTSEDQVSKQKRAIHERLEASLSGKPCSENLLEGQTNKRKAGEIDRDVRS